MCRPDGRHVFLKGKVQMITYLQCFRVFPDILYLTPWGPEQHFALINGDSDQPVFQMGI